HGPLVQGVCRRLLRKEHEVEDAFQATFLVLAQKAHAIRKRESLGSWLHGVAYRIAARARADAALRRAHEKKARTPSPCPAQDLSGRELCEVLDKELPQLREKSRAPRVLCYREGQTKDEAAQQLGWSPGRIKGLLERGRNQLRPRLTRRGISLPSALF